MTRKEAVEFLANTKVYVNGKSKEIQKKLFSLGYEWSDGDTNVCYTKSPFLYISSSMTFTMGNDMEHFSERILREISAEEILSLELTETTYRPFKDVKECWNEMQKHQPFGWIKSKCDGSYNYYKLITKVLNSTTIGKTTECVVGFNDDTLCYHYMVNLCDNYTFADGTPFGIKED